MMSTNGVETLKITFGNVFCLDTLDLFKLTQLNDHEWEAISCVPTIVKGNLKERMYCVITGPCTFCCHPHHPYAHPPITPLNGERRVSQGILNRENLSFHQYITELKVFEKDDAICWKGNTYPQLKTCSSMDATFSW